MLPARYHVLLKKDRREKFRAVTNRGWWVNAWRLADPVTGDDRVFPRFESRKAALEYAQQCGWEVQCESRENETRTDSH